MHMSLPNIMMKYSCNLLNKSYEFGTLQAVLALFVKEQVVCCRIFDHTVTLADCVNKVNVESGAELSTS